MRVPCYLGIDKETMMCINIDAHHSAISIKNKFDGK